MVEDIYEVMSTEMHQVVVEDLVISSTRLSFIVD